MSKATNKAGSAFDVMERNLAAVEQPDRPPTIADQIGRKRGNPSGRTGIQIRFTFEQWNAVRKFALEQNVSIQGLVILALDQLSRQHGGDGIIKTKSSASPSEVFSPMVPSDNDAK